MNIIVRRKSSLRVGDTANGKLQLERKKRLHMDRWHLQLFQEKDLH
jgi:hypothetical protein